MSNITLNSIELEAFGPFAKKQQLVLPKGGIVLVRGHVAGSGEGSGAGKSYFLNSVPFVLGGCPFPATELQSWFTDKKPTARLGMETSEGFVNAHRSAGLTIQTGTKSFKGGAAEVELDRVFGMDKKTRRMLTYRPQGEPGMFLSMSGPDKVAILSKLLKIEKVEAEAEAASQKARQLLQPVAASKQRVESAAKALAEAEAAVASIAFTPESVLERVREAQGRLKTHQEAARAKQEEVRALETRVREKAALVAAAEAELVSEMERWSKITNDKLNDFVLSREAIDVTEDEELASKHKMLQAREKTVLDHDKDETTRYFEIRQSLQITIQRLSRQASQYGSQCATVSNLESSITKLETESCPTCERPWQAPSQVAALDSARTRLGEEKARLEVFATARADLKKAEDELALVKKPEPHPFLVKIQAALAENQGRIEARAHRRRVERLASEDRRQQERDSLIASIAVEKATALDPLKIRLLDLRSAVRPLEEEIELCKKVVTTYTERAFEVGLEIHSYEVEGMRLEERCRVCDLAQVEKSKAEVELQKIQEQVALELDIEALLGRKGFLGSIFEDVLDEVAASANEILAGVTNVRHLVFGFSSERITEGGKVVKNIIPTIRVGGREASFEAGISGGMMSAVHLAVDGGFRDVVSRQCGSYPGWNFLDEAFNGLGPKSKASCLEILAQRSEGVLTLVVDHDSEFQGLFSNFIDVYQDTNGESTMRIS